MKILRSPTPRICKWFWKGCKPNFVCALRRRESFVSATNTRNPSAFAALERAAPKIPYLVLHPTGFSVPCCLRFTRCALTAPFHHHRACARLSIFCGTVRRKASRLSSRVYLNRYRLELRGIAPDGVRTFLFRLAPEAILRPSKTRLSLHWKIDLTSVRNRR